jgi:hypothetical protein
VEKVPLPEMLIVAKSSTSPVEASHTLPESVTMVLAKQMLNDSTNIIIEKRNFIYNDESI